MQKYCYLQHYLALLVCCFLLGCDASANSTQNRQEPSTPNPMPPAPSGETAAIPPWPAFVGKWWSPRCASREYRRIIELYADQTLNVTDIVAPCPEGANCIWSGIIDRQGTWRLRGQRLIEIFELLNSPENPRPTGPRGAPIPGALDWEADSDLLREAVPGESLSCEYRRLKSGADDASVQSAASDYRAFSIRRQRSPVQPFA